MENTAVTQKRMNSGRKVVFLEIMLLGLLAVIIGLVLRNAHLITDKSAGEGSWSVSQMREYANKLKSEGLTDRAVAAYEEYAQKGGLDKDTRSNIYFSLGEMLKNAKRYEDALAYFYKAEVVNPGTNLKQELGENIVLCLEKSGRTQDAEYQMESRTLLKNEEADKKPSGEVVARIKNREISMGEINRALDGLPPWMKEAYTKDETKKLDFLKSYVANELFYDKGVKRGINKDPAIRERAGMYEKELVIQEVLEQEVFSKIKAEEDDLKNYYEAHKDRYTEKEALRLRYILADTKEKAEELKKALDNGADFEKMAQEYSQDEATGKKGGVVSGWVYRTGYIPGVGNDKELTEQLFQLSLDKKPHIIKSEKGFYVSEITEKKEERIKPFEEVKQEVEASYRQDKSQKAVEKLVNDILAAKEVTIYSEKFLPKDTAKKERKE